jgi:voltage-gated potassium channel Kch
MTEAHTEPKQPPAGRKIPAGLSAGLAWVWGRLLRNVQLLAALIVAAALILGYVGLWQYLSGKGPAAQWGNTWDDILFYDLQLPVLSGAPLQVAGDFPVALSVARFLAPLGTFVVALAALELVLGDQWRGFLAAHARGHAIVAGEGAVALALARHLTGPAGKADFIGNGKVVLVSGSEETLAQARQRGILAVQGDPADRETLRAAGVARAQEIYACTAGGAANAAIALRARDAIAAGAGHRLSAYALVRDVELGVALRARRIGTRDDLRLRLDFFDVEDIAARKLLDAHPLTAAASGPGAGPGAVRVVIVGFGQLGRAILREVARRNRPAPDRPRVDVIIMKASEADVTEVTTAFPAIGGSCSVVVGQVPDVLQAVHCAVFVCLDDDDEALREGLAMAHSLAGQSGHVVVCLREASPLTGVLAARGGLVDDVMGRLSVFGVIEEACVPEDIRDDLTEQLARSIHRAYVAMEASRGETEATNPSMVSWERLPESLRQSNIAQAVDIGDKLATIGAVVVPESATAPEFAFVGDEVELLAKLEHQRWMSEKLADGWTYGQPRDNARKVHPDLKDWMDLNDATRDKDRNAIRSLPATLRAEGFQILRLPPS